MDVSAAIDRVTDDALAEHTLTLAGRRDRMTQATTAEADVLGFADASDDVFGFNNERRHGPSERWCQECGGKYRTDSCPCVAEVMA